MFLIGVRAHLYHTCDTAGLLRWEVWRAKPSKKHLDFAPGSRGKAARTRRKTQTSRGPQAPAPPPGEFDSGITCKCAGRRSRPAHSRSRMSLLRAAIFLIQF